MCEANDSKERAVAKGHGPSAKDDKQYEGLRKKGMYVSGGGYLELAPGLRQQRQEPRQRPK